MVFNADFTLFAKGLNKSQRRHLKKTCQARRIIAEIETKVEDLQKEG